MLGLDPEFTDHLSGGDSSVHAWDVKSSASCIYLSTYLPTYIYTHTYIHTYIHTLHGICDMYVCVHMYIYIDTCVYVYDV